MTERIAAIKAIILAYETAIIDLATGKIQSYSVDTGQTKQSATKSDLSALTNALPGLYGVLKTLCNLQQGTGSSYGRPAW